MCSTLCLTILLISTNYVLSARNFPDDFIWGASTSSYQIEGGWNLDGKGESIWDRRTHTVPEGTPDRSTGDISADSYHQWREDVRVAHELNLKSYRFSISWPRILPGGYANNVNKAGIEYYNNLINEVLSYNITPLVTIYHWDLPQKLQDVGGWTNPEIIPLFHDYAKLLFENFGDRVKHWITINEPWHICENGYGVGDFAPGIRNSGILSYMCGHNVLIGHAEVYHLYNDKFRKEQNGKIGITIDSRWYKAKTNSEEDKKAAEQAIQMIFGWFTHPIYSKTGNYPQVMIDRIKKLSKEQGFARSRLPVFTDKQIKRLRGSSDFFGLNTYTTNLVTRNGPSNSAQFAVPSYNHDTDAVLTYDPTWPSSGTGWLKVYPEGVYHLLKWIKNEYPQHPPIIITENGVSDHGGTNDAARIDYLRSYLGNILTAIEEGVNVKGYFVWSMIDLFAWRRGYTEVFGLYAVDFNDPNRKRTAKDSARFYSQLCKTGTLN